MNNIQQFKKKDNISILWIVLLDEIRVLGSETNILNSIKQIFDKNINLFIGNANNSNTLIELNKQFLVQIISAINVLFPHLKERSNMKSITIYPDEVKSELYKIEDIQESRKKDFDINFEKRKSEFEHYMVGNRPQEVDFSDKNTDIEIKPIENLIAEKIAERNVELNTLKNSNIEIQNITPEMDKKSNISLSINDKVEGVKHVSWNSNTINETELIPRNIFDTLKIKKTDVSERQYVEQESSVLPEVKRDVYVRNKTTFSQPINDSFRSELLEQMSNMNKKIDSLISLVDKLTKKLNISVDELDINTNDECNNDTN